MQPAHVRSLVERSQRGDRDAFSALVTAYRDRIFGFASRMLGDREQARNAAQETFVKAWAGLGGFDRTRPFEPWLFAIAAHVCTDLLRRRRPELTLDIGEADAPPAPEGDGPESALEDTDLARALRELSAMERTTLLLKHVRGFTYEEIAQITGLPVGTLKSHAHRGRRKLAERLGRSGDDDGLHADR